MTDHEEYRVFGPPGTGKTTFLAQQVETWARAEGSDSIMVASFTRAAASEIASRDLPLNAKQVGTLHSFAYRSIGGGFDVAEKHASDFNETYPSLALSVGAKPDVEDRVAEVSYRTDGDRLMAEWEVLRAQLAPPELWPSGVASFAGHWNEWKASNDLLDFTDMIEHALTDTTTAPGAPDIGFFDEVQDFTALELALVRRWAAGMERVVLAGDDDQCLYSFKGASPEAFLDPPVDDEHKRVLGHSYRVPRAVHAIASTWIEQLSRREPKHYEPRDADGSVRFLDVATCKVPELMVSELDEHLAVPDRTVMILTSCSYMLDAIKGALKARAVPFHNPYRRKRGDWNPLVAGTERRRTALDRLLAYLRTQPDVWGEDARFWSGEDCKAWVDVLASTGLLARGAKSRLVGFPGGEVDLDAFDALWVPEQLPDVIGRAATGDLRWFDEHLLSTKRKPFEFPMRVAAQRGGALLRERPRVVIGTIHSVKGAQADVVYLAPDVAIPSAQALASGNVVERDAIVRQFYVGMTRAREQLVILNRATPMSLDPEALMRGTL